MSAMRPGSVTSGRRSARRPAPRAQQDVLDHGPVLAGQLPCLVGAARPLRPAPPRPTGRGPCPARRCPAGPARRPRTATAAMPPGSSPGSMTSATTRPWRSDRRCTGRSRSARPPHGGLGRGPGLVRFEGHREDHAREHDPRGEREQWQVPHLRRTAARPSRRRPCRPSGAESTRVSSTAPPGSSGNVCGEAQPGESNVYSPSGPSRPPIAAARSGPGRDALPGDSSSDVWLNIRGTSKTESGAVVPAVHAAPPRGGGGAPTRMATMGTTVT